MIANSAVVGPDPETRQRLREMLATAPEVPVYRIGRSADPLPVTASFDPSDLPGSRSLLDWFEQLVVESAAPRDAVLVVDDWQLCHEQDPGLDEVVRWVAALGPRRGVRVVVTARSSDEIPRRVRAMLGGAAPTFLALHGLSSLGAHWKPLTAWDRNKTVIGVNASGAPSYINMNAQFQEGDGACGTVIAPSVGERAPALHSLLLGLMTTHSPADFAAVLIDVHGTGVFAGFERAPHVLGHFSGLLNNPALIDHVMQGLRAEAARRYELLRPFGSINIEKYRTEIRRGAALDPLPELLVCVEGVNDLLAVRPEFDDAMHDIAWSGYRGGCHLLLSDAFVDVPRLNSLLSPWWPKEQVTFPADLDEVARVLPDVLAASTRASS